MGLIFLDGGPLDGSAYDTKDLLGQPESALPQGYVWTSEKRTSARTGASAQVWRFAGDSVLPPQESPGKVAHPADVLDAAMLSAATVALDRADDVDWRARRDAVKATRKTVCEATGFKASRLYALEMGTGKAITDEERSRLDAVLSGLEAEALPPG